jgi:SAM-dependent methyltransferase
MSTIASSYDRLAPAYAEHFMGELAHKPLDRALLAMFAAEVGAGAHVADFGCGPGQIARDLAARGLAVVGVDLSPGMITLARELTPGVDFRVGSMLALDIPDASLGGLTAFYAIVHFSHDELARAACEMHRVLRPGGLALLSFHVGTERIHKDELLGAAVDLDFVFFEMRTVLDALERAGFAIEARIERAPYTAVEHPSTRGYVLARRATS